MLPLTQTNVVIIVAVIITLLFLIQRSGTDKVGRIFGPIMLLWFATLALLGIFNITKDFSILRAFNPIYGVRLLMTGMSLPSSITIISRSSALVDSFVILLIHSVRSSSSRLYVVIMKDING